MPDPGSIPFREADGNGHYQSKQLPQDKSDFLEALGLPAYAGDVISAQPSTVGGEAVTFWGTDGHTVKATTLTGLAKLTSGVMSAVAAPTGAVVGTTDVQTLTNKTIQGAVISAPTGITKADVGLGNVDNTSDVNKPLSNADQAALANKEDKSNKGITSGYAGLDTQGKVPLAQLPDAIIGASRYQGTWNAAINNPTIPPAAPANNGYYYSVSTSGSTNIDGISTWAVGDTIISNGTIWQKIPVANAVQSVNGKQGIVVINQNDVGLGNVNNTSDATKNSAVATLTNKTIDGTNNTLNVRLNTTDVSGSLPVNKLNAGTNASSSTFWRGDGQWVSPTGAGDVTGPGSATDGAVALFNGATGKALKTFSGAAGFGKLDANGVVTTQAQMQSGDLAPTVISGQTEKTVLDPLDRFLLLDTVTGQLRNIKAGNFARLPKSYLTGLVIANGTDAVNDIDVAVGCCRSDDDTADIFLTTPITKQIDAAWVAGTNQGGRDSINVPTLIDQSYHIFVIRNPTSGAVDVFISNQVAFASGAYPSGYSQRRRIGSFVRSGAGGIRSFTQYGDYFAFNAPVTTHSGASISQSSSFMGGMASAVPLGAKRLVTLQMVYTHSAGGSFSYVYDPDAGKPTQYQLSTSTTGGFATQLTIWCSSGSQVKVDSGSNVGTFTYYLCPLGYWDTRDK